MIFLAHLFEAIGASVILLGVSVGIIYYAIDEWRHEGKTMAVVAVVAWLAAMLMIVGGVLEGWSR